MKTIKEYMAYLFRSIMAGVCIGIGGTIYLLCDVKPLGAFMFATGLLLILIFGFNLYTGMIGYLFDNKLSYIPKLVIVWAGNYIGATLVGKISMLTRFSEKIRNAAQPVASQKISDGFLSLFLLGIFCGILVYAAVDIFRKNNERKDFMMILMPIMCVAAFIFAGYEHCIADMFYISAAGKATEGIPCILIVTLGNSIGGLVIPIVKKIAEKLSDR